MQYQKYDEYKDSEAPWIGNIPSHWDVKKIGQCFLHRKEKVSDKDFEPLSVTMQGIVPQLETAAKSDSGDDRKKVCIGDFVINSRSDRKGSSGVSPLDGSVSLISIILKPLVHDNGYIHHLLRSFEFQEEFYRNGKGIVADLWSTKYSEMKNIKVPLPSIEEQKAIAEFIDEKTSQIDTHIDKQERLITLLKERRTTIINKAVTRGLDGNVKLKDSGIDWLGEIPEHWEVKKLKRLGSAITGLTYNPSNMVDEGEGRLVLRSSNVQNGKISLHDNVYVKGRIPRKLVTQEGDILICSRNGSRDLIGKNAIIDAKSSGLTFGAFMTVFRSIHCKFLHTVFNSSIFTFQSASFLTSTINQLTIGNLNSFQIPFPPVDEQQNIIDYCANVNKTTDNIIETINKEIFAFKEYRQSLISNAVTGKIRVI